MGGDIKLKESQRGLTNVAFRIPVKRKNSTRVSNGSLLRSISPQNSSNISNELPRNRSRGGSSYPMNENLP